MGSDWNWIWIAEGTIATGVGTNGLAVTFANLTGTERGGYLNVVLFSPGAMMWANGCAKEFVSSSSSISATPAATAGGDSNNPYAGWDVNKLICYEHKNWEEWFGGSSGFSDRIHC